MASSVPSKRQDKNTPLLTFTATRPRERFSICRPACTTWPELELEVDVLLLELLDDELLELDERVPELELLDDEVLLLELEELELEELLLELDELLASPCSPGSPPQPTSANAAARQVTKALFIINLHSNNVF